MLRSSVTRVPLIVVWPGRIARGRRFAAPVSMIDVLPTVLDVVGLPGPEVTQGQSLAPLLRGQPGPRLRPVIFDELEADGATGELSGQIEVIDGEPGSGDAGGRPATPCDRIARPGRHGPAQRMRLLSLTAGAAEMYCGSCLRDNALASALLARGHDVVLAPVYTPTTTDERNVSAPHVLFGGISVYLEQHVPLFRHTPAWLDRVWDSTPVLKLASKRQIKVDPQFLGGMTVSMLKGADGHQKKEVDKMLRWLEHLPPFDVVNLPFTLLIGLARPLREALGVPIACTLQGEDLFLDNLQEPWKSESMDLIRQAVPDVDVFFAVSDYYRDYMAGYFGIPADRIRTVPIGITLEGHDAQPLRTAPPYTVGYFARVAPEKGLHVLVEAYRRLRTRPNAPPTRLVAGGYLLDEHRDYLAGLERQGREWGFGDEFRYAGAPDRAGKIALLQSFDVFSVPATYHEPKGFFLLEAMANGVPVVQPAHGAFPEIVTRTGGGLLVTPDDPDALADTLLNLLVDRDRAQALGTAGSDGVRAHYTVDAMAGAAERELLRLIATSAAVSGRV